MMPVFRLCIRVRVKALIFDDFMEAGLSILSAHVPRSHFIY